MSIENITSTFFEILEDELVSRHSFDMNPSVTIRIGTDLDYTKITAVWEGTDIPVIPPLKGPAPPITITVDQLAELNESLGLD